MTAIEKYKLWLDNTESETEIYEELLSIEAEPEEIESRFHTDLEFGTAGLRGIMGAGSNRMNIINIRHTTQGFADYIKAGKLNKSVAIAYDTRLNSRKFAEAAACVMASNGIKAYISEGVMATPMLSYTIRSLDCGGGINITASHNPYQYSGYKCYGPDGCQMTEFSAGEVSKAIAAAPVFSSRRYEDFDALLKEGLIAYIPGRCEADYLEAVYRSAIFPQIVKKSGLKLVYTALNGVGTKPVSAILDKIGADYSVVDEQMGADPYFSCCPFPNPELPETFNLAFEQAAGEAADLVIATDPDCDRLGLAVKDGKGEYALLSGDEVGCLLLNYVLFSRFKAGTLPDRPVFINTVVSTPMGKKIADSYGCETRSVLTGFKYIGEQITLLEGQGRQEDFMLAYEESIGYLIGAHARDKDAVVAAMVCCEMAASYKLQGLSLLDGLRGLYHRFGSCHSKVLSFMLEGYDYKKRMAAIMQSFRESAPESIAGLQITQVHDYLASEAYDKVENRRWKLSLPKSDVLGLFMGETARVMLRPSGTEPKLKMYFSACGENIAEAKERAEAIEAEMTAYFKRF